MMINPVPGYIVAESFKEPIIKIDFDPNAAWRLLVIDDRVIRMEDMCETIGKTGITPLIDYKSVIGYFNRMKTSAEPFEKSLLLLPWMVHDVWGFGSICFAPFPCNDEHLREILDVAREAREDRTAIEQLAALIDIYDTRGSVVRERFTDTWRMLNDAGHPAHLRARFTRGAEELEEWVNDVPVIPKQPPQGGDPKHKELVHAWLDVLREKISGDLFQSLTTGSCKCCIDHQKTHSCHHASTIGSSPVECRICIANKLRSSDGYGVWPWVLEVLDGDPLHREAPNRWLAAKAFQTTDPNSESVPVTAIIGICEGAKFLSPELKGNYAVISSLLNVPWSEIRDLPALGTISLANGRYEAFAAALRDWIIFRQQFEEGNGRVKSVRISSDDKTTSVRFEYSAAIDRIFTSNRRGGTVRAWEKLGPFARTVTHEGAMVQLVFDNTR
jgi:hypothetical protein